MTESKSHIPTWSRLNNCHPRSSATGIFLIAFVFTTLLLHVLYWGGLPHILDSLQSAVTTPDRPDNTPANHHQSPLNSPNRHSAASAPLPVVADDLVPLQHHDAPDDALDRSETSGTAGKQSDGEGDVRQQSQTPTRNDGDAAVMSNDQPDTKVSTQGQTSNVEENATVSSDSNQRPERNSRQEEQSDDNGDASSDSRKRSGSKAAQNHSRDAVQEESMRSDSAEGPGPRCPHLILISGPRHGSTWFVNSVESCRYSRIDKDGLRFYRGSVFGQTEIWHSHEGPVQKISAEDAVTYIQRNSSVKIFPKLKTKRERVISLLSSAVKLDIPIIVLTRKITSTFSSLTLAREKKQWNKVPSTPGLEQREVDEEANAFLAYKEEIEDFFQQMDVLLKQFRPKLLDYMDYDEVKDMKYIHAPNCGCYIHNCNFMDNADS